MKRIIAIALLGTLPLLAPVQAREAITFKPWGSQSEVSLGAVEHDRPTRHEPLNHRPQKERHTRPTSLHHASERLEHLLRRQSRLEQDLKRAQRHHASRYEIRSLRQSLRLVGKTIQLAKRDYAHFLKLKIGVQPFRLLLQHTAWLSGQQKPPPGHHTGQSRPDRWR